MSPIGHACRLCDPRKHVDDYARSRATVRHCGACCVFATWHSQFLERTAPVQRVLALQAGPSGTKAVYGRQSFSGLWCNRTHLVTLSCASGLSTQLWLVVSVSQDDDGAGDNLPWEQFWEEVGCWPVISLLVPKGHGCLRLFVKYIEIY